MAEEVRQRGKASSGSIETSKTSKLAASQPQKARPSRFKLEWDLIFWLFASFAMLYFTNFASHILFNTAVKRLWLAGSVLAIVVCTGSLVYAHKRYPALNTNNWQQYAPALIAMATISALSGIISFSVAIWPVWRFYTLLMVPTLTMGFISAVSLFNL